MNRRSRIVLLSLSLLLVVGMLGWLTNVLLSQSESTGRTEHRIKVEEVCYEAKMDIERLLSSFITFEQSRGYFEYLPSYASRRPYDQRMTPPLPEEERRVSNLKLYLPDYVKVFFQVDPDGSVSSPRSADGMISCLQKRSGFYERLSAKVAMLIALPSQGNIWEDMQNQIIHEQMERPPDKGGPLHVESVSSFVMTEDQGDLFMLRQVKTTAGAYLQGAWIDMDKLNSFFPNKVKELLPKIRLAVYDPYRDGDDPRSASFAFANAPLFIDPGAEDKIPLREHWQMLTWTLVMIWSIVLLGAAGVVMLMLGSFRLEQRRGDFVSAVTHELRTPLTTLSLYTEMLEDGFVPEQKKQEYYGNMQRECRRLGHLIDNVLAYSKLQKNAIRRTKDTLTCLELFEPIAEKTERRLKAAGIGFSFVLAQNIRVLPIHTDAVAVEQIMDNLTTNAIKYAKVEDAIVRMTVQAARRYVMIRFRDNGPGIPTKLHKLVFKAFRRAPEAVNGRQAGVGLGLALARDIAHSLGGDLSLEVSSLQGASFLLKLPKN